MARFDKLEFGDPAPAKPRASPVPQGATDWLAAADRERRHGHYENALRYYSRALEDDKSLVSGWLGQVQMLVQLAECPEAELWSGKALELFPSHGDLLAGRAQAMCRQGGASQALAICDGAMKQAGNSAYRWQVRGEILVATGQAVDRHCFDKAQQLDPDWLVPLEAALICLHYRHFSIALERARQAASKAPDQYYAWYVQGVCQLRSGMEQPARNSFQRCLELCPRHIEAEARLLELDKAGSTLGGIVRRLWRRS